MGTLIEVISKQALDDVGKLLKSIEANSKALDELNKKAKQTKLPSDISKLQKDAAAIMRQSNETAKQSIRIENQLRKERAKLTNATSASSKEIIKARIETQRINKTHKTEARLLSSTTGAYERLRIKLNEAEKEYKDLAASTKASNVQTEKARSKALKMREALNSVGDGLKSPKRGLFQFKSLVSGIVGAFGVIEGLRFGINFTKDAIAAATEAKSVEFAFVRLGDRGSNAFDRIKKSTRGLLSDLDIKKSIVNFDNFNLSLEESDTLFEFLAVRAAQTGESVEKLRDSLVEGLSKESKLRIDNLGISASELNNELEKTPDFVKAVANIAKREVKEAGSILDDAASSQQQWNAELENFKLRIGNSLVSSGFISGIQKAGIAVLNLISPMEKLSEQIQKEQVELNVLVGNITDVNTSNEEREKLLNTLKTDYPQFLNFLKDEKTDNENLSIALKDINDQYIKRIALQTQQEKIEKFLQKAGERQNKLALSQVRVNRKLASINTTVLKGSLDLTNKSYQERIDLVTEALKRTADFSANQRTGAKVANNEEAKALQTLSGLILRTTLSRDQLGKATSSLAEEEQLMTDLEEQLGTSIEAINALFSKNTEEKDKNLDGTEELTEAELKALAAKRKIAAELKNQQQFDIDSLGIEKQIKAQKRIIESEKSTAAERILASEQLTQKQIELAELSRVFQLNESGRTALGKEIIEAKHAQELEKIRFESEQRMQGIIKDAAQEVISNRQNALSEKEKQIQESYDDELDALKKSLLNNEITVKEYQDREKAIKLKAAKEVLTAKLFLLEKELEAEKIAGKDTAGLLNQIKAIRKKIRDSEVSEFFESEDKKQAKAEETQKKIQELLNETFSVFENATGIAASTFKGLFDNIKSLIEESAEEAFTISRAFELVGEQARFNEKIERLEIGKEIELQFAGDSTAAREEIERRYQEREKELKRKQLENEKKIALFRIAVNTATGVTAALTSIPPNIILSKFIAITGLAQAAVVAAKQIPQFKDGVRDFSGGLAVLGDGGVSEIARTPHGNVFKTPNTDTLYNLPKGTDVFKNEREFEKELALTLGENGINGYGDAIYGQPIAPTVSIQMSGGITEDQMMSIMKKTLAKMPVNNVVMDKRGFTTFMEKGHSQMISRNNRVSNKGKSV